MADSNRPTLTVEERPERGTRANKRLRRQGLVPGIVYGGTDGECHPFKVDSLVLRKVLVDGSALIDLELGGGKSRPVIVKDQQLHPVRGEVVHIDLLEVDLKQTIQSQVAVHVEGADDAPGVREGGVLEQVTHQLNIEALPTDIPEAIVDRRLRPRDRGDAAAVGRARTGGRDLPRRSRGDGDRHRRGPDRGRGDHERSRRRPSSSAPRPVPRASEASGEGADSSDE